VVGAERADGVKRGRLAGIWIAFDFVQPWRVRFMSTYSRRSAIFLTRSLGSAAAAAGLGCGELSGLGRASFLDPI